MGGISADKHHLLNTRAAWSSHMDAKWLREQPTLVPTLDRGVHEELHATTPPVPLLGYHALHIVRGTFHPASTTLGSIDRLTSAIEAAGNARRMHYIDKQLCELAIRAIRLQVPILRGEVREDWA